ncbi:LuxR family transcriptional regulator [Aeromicrobium camelliae]|uniref:LuxR family transcriptional regulator n=1 Tax=Aeromicrobium camelliae TaxID=1538144 RepID=A0A3N6WXA6_9ACTN|nr:LuxR family transcriptional regulator [Aeromicrobium camelliae]RQN09652.1 LuxR family transcriptional regulator [Aeromicrobium camelliae]
MDSISVEELADEHLAHARSADSGRSAQALHPGRQHLMRQTLIALRGGAGMNEHLAPAEATLLVLRGRVSVSTQSERWEGGASELLVLPDDRHDLQAHEDSVVLLTTLAGR